MIAHKSVPGFDGVSVAVVVAVAALVAVDNALAYQAGTAPLPPDLLSDSVPVAAARLAAPGLEQNPSFDLAELLAVENVFVHHSNVPARSATEVLVTAVVADVSQHLQCQIADLHQEIQPLWAFLGMKTGYRWQRKEVEQVLVVVV